MEMMPNEIWCIIFSYLDENSVKNATVTCKLWFELIRSDSNLSGHVILQHFDLDELQTKIENSQWIWERWPVLRTLEFERGIEPESAKEALDSLKSIKFELCPTLENVIFGVNFDLVELFPSFQESLVTVEKLTFNPNFGMNSLGFEFKEVLGLEHVSWLHINLKAFQSYKTLDLIEKNAKNLVKITINIVHFFDTNSEMLKATFDKLFKGLNTTLKTVHLNNMAKLVDGNIILQSLSENCTNLENLNIFPNHHKNWKDLPKLDNPFKNLKQLTVPKFVHIDCLACDCETLREIYVETVLVDELKNFNVAEINQRFKNIKKFQIDVMVTNANDFNQCTEWQNTFGKEIRDIIEVNIVNQGFFQIYG